MANMTFTYRPAHRENVPLLIGLAGGTGSGKTMSALRLARGIAQGKPFAGLDTENGRMLHYADLFPELQHARLDAPFRPERYAEAIEAADKQGFPVIVVDSASHEWAGDGGCLDWHDELMGGDQAKNFAAWQEPKRAHKKLLTRLLWVKAHVILCFRAEPKVEVIRENGRMKIVPKESPTMLDGWLPISEKMLPYELTASFLLMADAPGIPRPIKLQEQHRPFVPLNQTLSEEVGLTLAGWAAGSSSTNEEPQADALTRHGRSERQSHASPLVSDSVSQDATGEPASSGLTMTELRHHVEQAGVTPEHGSAVMARLYPGRKSSELTDEERAVFWAKLESSIAEGVT